MKYFRSLPLLFWTLFVAVTMTLVAVALYAGDGTAPADAGKVAATRPADEQSVWGLSDSLAAFVAAVGRGDSVPVKLFAQRAETAATVAPASQADILATVATLAGQLAAEIDTPTDLSLRDRLTSRITGIVMALAAGQVEEAATLAAAELAADPSTPTSTLPKATLPPVPQLPPLTLPTPDPLPAPQVTPATLPPLPTPPTTVLDTVPA